MNKIPNHTALKEWASVIAALAVYKIGTEQWHHVRYTAPMVARCSPLASPVMAARAKATRP